MSGSPPKDAGFKGAVLAGLFGIVVGFVVGFLAVGVLIPFSDPSGESRGWLLFSALLVGIGTAPFGGLVGLLSGSMFGFRATVLGTATYGVLAGLVGVVFGFFVGWLLTGLKDQEWDILSEGSAMCAVVGGIFGMIGGTFFGARKKLKRYD